MADSDTDVAVQITALVAAIQDYQGAALGTIEQDRQALLDALAALGDIDVTVEQKVLALIGQPSSYFNNLTDLVKDVLSGMPDLGGFTHTISDLYLLDEPVQISFSGATSSSDEPISYKLSNPINCTVSKYELAADEAAELTPVGAGTGSVTVTAISNGVPAAPMIISFSIVAGEILLDGFTSPITGDSSYQAGESTTVQFSGATATDGSAVTYQLSNLIGLTASATTVEEGGSVAFTITGAPGTTASFTVTVVAGDISSEPQIISFEIAAVTVSMAGFSHTVASSYMNGESTTVQFSGATASDGGGVTYQLSSLVGCSAGKSTSITAGESVQLDISGSSGMIGVKAVSGVAISALEVISFSIQAPSMNRPSITTPSNNATGISLTPVLTSTGYSTSPANYDSHSQSRWKITTTGGSIVWESGAVSSLTAISVQEELPADTQLKIYVQHRGSLLGWGDWSSAVSVRTEQALGVGVVLDNGATIRAMHEGYWLAVSDPSAWTVDIFGLVTERTELFEVTAHNTPDPSAGWQNTNELINGYGSVVDHLGNVGPIAALHCRDEGTEFFLGDIDEMSALAVAQAFTGVTGFIYTSTTVNNTMGQWKVDASGSSHILFRTDTANIIPICRVLV